MQKYKVFINDAWIFFGEFNEEYFAANEDYKVLDSSRRLILNFTVMIKAWNLKTNIVLNTSDNPKADFEYFLAQFLVLEAAGGIVQNENESFLMIKRFGLWDFPKGKIEAGESAREAALREVEEETAAKELITIKQLPESYHIYRYANKWIVKRSFWFQMETKYAGKLIPQLDEDILEAIWVPRNIFPEYLDNTYSTLREMVYASGLI